MDVTLVDILVDGDSACVDLKAQSQGWETGQGAGGSRRLSLVVQID